MKKRRVIIPPDEMQIDESNPLVADIGRSSPKVAVNSVSPDWRQ